ncbi:MAG: Ig-like domain-containing protein, partial [Bacteroidota bacterium]
MNRFAPLGLFALLLFASSSQAQVTGLSDWTLYLDPGHSQNENVGVYGYSEARKVLRIGLALKEMLETRTDIEAVHISRTNDTQQVGLSQRSDQANALGVDFFHSIHSNAGGPSTNNTLMLYGGWRSNGQTVEKTPEGGGRMGDEFIRTLTAAMRIPTIGNYADRTFYQGFPANHTNQFPYLSVNRRTNMASVLSEGGFHTNPAQNTRNMNADWKRLEAQAHYWSILDWHGIERSVHRIATGIVTDVENGWPINGATITIDGQTYTTDTYETLFNQYSNDPDELANGFYYLEDLGAGTHTVTIEADGYESFSGSITMEDTTFTFLDASLLSTVPPTVAESTPQLDDVNVRVTDPLTVIFSRPMDRAATEAAFSLTPAGGSATTGSFAWRDNDYRLVFTPDADLQAETIYTLAIDGAATGAAGDALDGNADGTGGDTFSLSFTSGFPDALAPRLTESFPAIRATDVRVQPVVTVAFDELVDLSTLDGRVVLETSANGTPIPGSVQASNVSERTVVSFAPDAPLDPDTGYRFAIEPGVQDLFLNTTTSRYQVFFTTGETGLEATPIDSFEGTSITDNWWLPQQSGSTGGIVTDSTDRSIETDIVNPLGGASAMRIDYGWQEGGGPWLIRQYLNSGAPFSRRFTADGFLQAYVYGDGSGTLFRFAVDDATSTEVSSWVEVDWYGWRPVEWDLSAGETGTWLGSANGTLDGQLRFDSIQLSYAPGGALFGSVVVDDLRIVQPISVDNTTGPETEAFAVFDNRPNPFRDATDIPFQIASS